MGGWELRPHRFLWFAFAVKPGEGCCKAFAGGRALVGSLGVCCRLSCAMCSVQCCVMAVRLPSGRTCRHACVCLDSGHGEQAEQRLAFVSAGLQRHAG